MFVRFCALLCSPVAALLFLENTKAGFSLATKVVETRDIYLMPHKIMIITFAAQPSMNLFLLKSFCCSTMFLFAAAGDDDCTEPTFISGVFTYAAWWVVGSDILICVNLIDSITYSFHYSSSIAYYTLLLPSTVCTNSHLKKERKILSF